MTTCGIATNRENPCETDCLAELGERIALLAAQISEVPWQQRRADALVLVAESALAAGLDPGTRGDRYQVVVHVEAETLTAEAEDGASCLVDGPHVSAETSRRIACDAARVVLLHGLDGRTLAVGRRTRAISPGLRRALEHRDGGCRFPGCRATLCDAHHVRHWADGGETTLSNTVLLCRRHHRAVHQEGFSMELESSGEARFYRPNGLLLPLVPALPAIAGHPLAAAREKAPAAPDWWGGPIDYNWEIEWLREVRERAAAAD